MLVPKLNIAIPSPASDNIDIDPFIIEGIWMFHLKIQKQILLIHPCLTSMYICMITESMQLTSISA